MNGYNEKHVKALLVGYAKLRREKAFLDNELTAIEADIAATRRLSYNDRIASHQLRRNLIQAQAKTGGKPKSKTERCPEALETEYTTMQQNRQEILQNRKKINSYLLAVEAGIEALQAEDQFLLKNLYLKEMPMPETAKRFSIEFDLPIGELRRGAIWYRELRARKRLACILNERGIWGRLQRLLA